MSTRLNPYLHFTGTAREAIAFYASVFGGEPTISTFGEYGLGDDTVADRVMHGQLETPSGLLLMVSDAMPDDVADHGEGTISLSLSGGPEDAAEIRGCWERLVEGGTVEEPLAQAPWGDTFGMCTDRFGTHWLVNIGA